MSDILIIKHLPKEFSNDEKKDFLKHFGALDVKIIASRKKYSLAFAKFENNYQAQIALNRLHQLDVLGRKLSVEFAIEKFDYASSDGISKNPPHIQAQKNYETFLHKLNTWHSDLDLAHPPPNYLFYNYPAPTTEVLKNICSVLNNIPKFYTQVLHLMNKMNLPCPFDGNFSEEMKIFIPTASQSNISLDISEQIQTQEKEPSTSDDESELESDGEEKRIEIVPRINLKRKKPLSRPTLSKILKLSSIKTTSRIPLNPAEVFEPIENDPISKTNMKLEFNTKYIEERFNIFTKKLSEETETKEKSPEFEEDSNYISSRQLSSNRLPPKEYNHLNVFKNYQKGVPSCRLYIKNIAKVVTMDDLKFIYRRFYIAKNDPQGTMFDIQYMNEGRLKGQAFITLQSIELADKAIEETNGYILKDKPLVVQFARSAKKKTNESKNI